MPKIRFAHLKNSNFFFLYGDIQPMEEQSSHSFANEVLKTAKKLGIKTVITLGGIGMAELPEKPIVYITGNNEKIVKKYSTSSTKSKILGIVGPIVGATGLLVGLAGKYKLDAVAYLAESFAHPLHVGVKESFELLKILKSKMGLGISLKEFQKDITKLEKDQRKKIKDLREVKTAKKKKDTSYIG
ncbi:PAC2 family protein [Pseudomonadota bacterium]